MRVSICTTAMRVRLLVEAALAFCCGTCAELCVATETRPLDRLGQLGEFEQDSSTDAELESNTDLHSARRVHFA